MLLRNGTRWWLECLGLCAGARPPARLRALGSSRWPPGSFDAHVNPTGGGLGGLPTMPPVGFSCAVKG